MGRGTSVVGSLWESGSVGEGSSCRTSRIGSAQDSAGGWPGGLADCLDLDAGLGLRASPAVMDELMSGAGSEAGRVIQRPKVQREQESATHQEELGEGALAAGRGKHTPAAL